MMKRSSVLPVLFTLVMLICVLFLAWYLPASGKARFSLEDVKISLDTSLGRERKQQYEYNNTVAAIPETEAELERLLPLAESAEAEVKELKKERDRLKKEKKELEGSSLSGAQEESGNE